MLEKLRKAMKAADIDMLLIPSADPHGSEYPEEYFKARKHFSGFTGSGRTEGIFFRRRGSLKAAA